MEIIIIESELLKAEPGINAYHLLLLVYLFLSSLTKHIFVVSLNFQFLRGFMLLVYGVMEKCMCKYLASLTVRNPV